MWQSIRYSDIWSLGISAYELFFGDSYNAVDETRFCTNPPKLKPKKDGLSKECCKFINQCFTKDYRKRPKASDLLGMDWMKKIKKLSVKQKWAPWFIDIVDIEEEEEEEEVQEDPLLFAIDSLSPKHFNKNGMRFDDEEKSTSKVSETNNSSGTISASWSSTDKSAKSSKSTKKEKKKRGHGIKKKIKKIKKSVKFTDSTNDVQTQKSLRGTAPAAGYNEDLFFMITSMVIYYLTQSVDFEHEQKEDDLSRRKSHMRRDVNDSGKVYSDEERIANMAKYGHCSKEMVREKIRVTVAHIKAQMNKIEMMQSR